MGDGAPNVADILFPVTGRRIWVAGHGGMVGAATARALTAKGATVLAAARRDLDLRRQADVEAFVQRERPDAVVIAAATVGGILANDSRPADFIYDNLAIEANVIHASWQAGAKKLLFLGSSCIYPRLAHQPMAEDALLTGPLEPTNQWYAVAKIAGIKLCQAYRRQYGADFISAMPTNLYGPGDNFHPEASHVIPGLMRRIHDAKTTGASTVAIWGTGRPRREFLYVDDLARALVHLLEVYSGESHVNVGTGDDLAIADLAQRIADAVGYRGAFRFDATKPDGAPRKLLDVAKIKALGWRAETPLDRGLAETYRWFRDNVADAA